MLVDVCVGVCVCVCVCDCVKRIEFFILNYMPACSSCCVCVCVCAKKTFVRLFLKNFAPRLRTANCELWTLSRPEPNHIKGNYANIFAAHTSKHKTPKPDPGNPFWFCVSFFFQIFFPARTLSAWGGNGNQKYSMLVNRKTSKISRGKGVIPIPPKNPSFIAHWSSLFGFGLLLIVFGRVYVGP